MAVDQRNLEIGKTFKPIVLGADILGYSYTRQFHEIYGIDSIVLAQFDIKATSRSKYCEYRMIDGVDDEVRLLAYLRETILPECERQSVKPLLVGSGDFYAELLSKNKQALEADGFAVPYNDYSIFSVITMKEQFYAICEKLGVPYPKTWLVPCSDSVEPIEGLPLLDDEVIDRGSYPMIAKPANSAEWHYAELEDKHKVYIVESADYLRKLIRDVKNSSYDKYLLVQECLEDRDESLHSVTVFCHQGEMVLGCVGHVLAQDHRPEAIGNPLCILGEDRPDLLEAAARFCKEVGYEGYGNFDVMDNAQGEPHFLEINARPGRNSYYMTLAGVPFVKPIVEKYVCGNDPAQTLSESERRCDEPFLFCVPPAGVVRKNIEDSALRAKFDEAVRVGLAKSPLLNPQDSLSQRFYARLNWINSFGKC